MPITILQVAILGKNPTKKRQKPADLNQIDMTLDFFRNKKPLIISGALIASNSVGRDIYITSVMLKLTAEVDLPEKAWQYPPVELSASWQVPWSQMHNQHPIPDF